MHPDLNSWQSARKLIGLALSVFALGWLGSVSLHAGPVGPSSHAVIVRAGVATADAAQDELRAPAIGAKVGTAQAGATDPKKERPDTEPRELQSKAAGKPSGSLSWFSMTMSAVAGLVLFIYGVAQLAQGLGDLNSERMRRWTSRFTSNRLAGVATGFGATTLLESSSVVIIMVIAMVSGGVLTFVQSLGVVLGANIGTAVGAQIIAFDIEQYIPILMLGGLLLLFIPGKSETRKKLGLVVLGFGLMFYGLEAIDQSMKPLRDYPPFMALMQSFGRTPLYGALFGAAFTVLVQSSSAVVAIVITLAGSGLLDLPAGVAIMLGAEIGTCSDTLVATIGRGRPALRTGAFHLGFNLVSACIGVALAPQLVHFVQSISGGASVGRQIANAQMLFNTVGVVIVLPVLPMIARALERLIPDAQQQHAPSTQAQPAE